MLWTKTWLRHSLSFFLLRAVFWVGPFHKTAGASTKAAMAQADLPVSDDGNLMLFDDMSEYNN